jgi:phospholipid/cholesterol/gamma-HCH transport system substrate-binding protein
MTRSPMRDLLVGLFVLGGLGAIAYLSLSVGGLSYTGPRGLTLFADFDEIGGLKPRAPVVISGVKVGQVGDIALGESYRAHVRFELDPKLQLPKDTSASIVTSGVLGDRYVSLQLGGDDKMLQNGDAIAFTDSAVILERLIGKLVYNIGEGKKAGDGDADTEGK